MMAEEEAERRSEASADLMARLSGARITYYCAYCGYRFAERPALPAKCPRCGRTLTEVGRPEVSVRARRRPPPPPAPVKAKLLARIISKMARGAATAGGGKKGGKKKRG
jgi:DNA-directed RNA polymerase subunit RPC12/RpoP